MKTFDIHLHVQPWQMLKAGVLAMIDDESHRGAKEILSSAETLLRWMDTEGIERACCINYVSPDVMGFTPETNDWIAAFTKDHRDRLLPVGSVHPKTTPAMGPEMERVLDLGIRMVKIHPPHQLFPANAYRFELPGLADVYRICAERRVPVMVHTGTSVFPGARNVYADPMAVDDVAVDFPNLRIILAHAGRPLYGETAMFLARRHPNVRFDLSGIPPKSLLQYLPRLPLLASKALWGTDWPSPGVTSPAKNVRDFLALGLGAETEIRILRTNAEEWFGER